MGGNKANNVRKQKKSFVVSTLITLFIVAMLIFSGPASAVIVSISGLSGSITQGSSKEFNISITLESPDKYVPISNLSLNISGNTPKQCIFDTAGTIISCDSGITISAISPANASHYGGPGSGYGVDTIGSGFGYDFGGSVTGYGYSNGAGGGEVTFTYHITLSTSGMSTGDYSARAYLNTGNNALAYFASSTASFTIASSSTTSTTSNGGGGTGGGGVTTPEPIQNIVKHETRDCNVLSAKPSSCKFSVPEHWVYELVITGKENEIVTFRIEALKGLSSKVPVPAPGTQYLNIWPDSKRIKEALIRFRVENSWIASEGLTPDNLRMYRWDGKKWNELETRVLSINASATNYEAKTDGFAYFAITGPKATTVAETTAVPTATAPGGTPSITATATQKAGQPLSPVYFIILIGVIAVAAYLNGATQKKK
ncbi:MAG: PGF-pre-PGF domain-containing protein [Euryarchaeota archaeon]|nr:PGF-pre-PGF domain-containing protein [Euryarchaeota archaeon]